MPDQCQHRTLLPHLIELLNPNSIWENLPVHQYPKQSLPSLLPSDTRLFLISFLSSSLEPTSSRAKSLPKDNPSLKHSPDILLSKKALLHFQDTDVHFFLYSLLTMRCSVLDSCPGCANSLGAVHFRSIVSHNLETVNCVIYNHFWTGDAAVGTVTLLGKRSICWVLGGLPAP